MCIRRSKILIAFGLILVVQAKKTDNWHFGNSHLREKTADQSMPERALPSLLIDWSSGIPLSRQVYDALSNRIADGRIGAGTRLPASRKLAADLGVSRTTISSAYDQLIAEGYAEGRRGSGVYATLQPEIEAVWQVRITRQASSAVSTRPRIRPFQPGTPDMRLFPYGAWSRSVARVARAHPRALVVCDDSFGDLELRKALASHLLAWRGVAVAPERVVITAGAMGAIELILRALTKPGDTICLEDPGYPPVRRLAGAMGLTPLWLPAGSDGPEVQLIDGGSPIPNLTVLTPSHQFPLGGTMPRARRLRFLDFAERTGGWIIEDDFNSEFRYTGRPVPALASFGEKVRVLYVGSLSKVFSTDVRIGFLAFPAPLTTVITRTVDEHGTGASLMPQRPLAEFIQSGQFHRHIRCVRRIYAVRGRELCRLLQSKLGKLVTFKSNPAGMHLAAVLPDSVDDRVVASRAREEGVTCLPLSSYYALSPRKSGLLLGFGAFEEREMRQSMAILREILSGYRRTPSRE